MHCPPLLISRQVSAFLRTRTREVRVGSDVRTHIGDPCRNEIRSLTRKATNERPIRRNYWLAEAKRDNGNSS